MDLSFNQLRKANVGRCEAVFHPLHDWTPTDWATAMAGECGEACDQVKKLRRLGPTPETIPNVDTASGRAATRGARARIGDELADLIIYADLLAARLGIDLGRAVAEKFNEVSAEMGTDYLLPTI
jgi:NTP pyrophosphatase (non-canonical NTP hydrolase)